MRRKKRVEAATRTVSVVGLWTSTRIARSILMIEWDQAI